MRVRSTLILTTAAAALVAGAAVPALADSGTSAETVIVSAGGLAMTAPAAKTLGTVAPGSLSVGDTLGTTKVTDTRGGVAGFGVTAGSGEFASGGDTIAATRVDYDSGAVDATTGSTAVTKGPQTDLSSPRSVVSASATDGYNTATWDPTLKVNLPTNVKAGSYVGTITTSVS